MLQYNNPAHLPDQIERESNNKSLGGVTSVHFFLPRSNRLIMYILRGTIISNPIQKIVIFWSLKQTYLKLISIITNYWKLIHKVIMIFCLALAFQNENHKKVHSACAVENKSKTNLFSFKDDIIDDEFS